MVSEAGMPDKAVKAATGKNWAERRSVQAAAGSVARAKTFWKALLAIM